MSPDRGPASTVAAEPLPVIVIGGYLGAGKTTLVNHLLRQSGGRRIAVLVNDFGDIAIDAELIAAEHPDGGNGVLNLAGGCLCCSFGDDLVGTLAGLTRRNPAPDLVLIELSGVALPATVVRTAGLAPQVAVAGTLVLADAGAVQRQAADRYVGDTVRQQLREADWVLLNKPDLVDAAALLALTAQVAALAPQARVLAAAAADMPPELVLGWPARQAEGPVQHQAWSPRPIGPSAQTRAAALFASRSLVLPAGTDLAALGQALADPASGVLRAKGLLPGVDGQGHLLQVAGGRWQVTPVRWDGPGGLVLIGLQAVGVPAGWADGPLAALASLVDLTAGPSS